MTQAIAAAGRNASIGLRGPFGSNWPINTCLQGHSDPKEVIIVAGAIGLAPLRSALYALSENRRQLGKITLLIGGKSPQDLLFEVGPLSGVDPLLVEYAFAALILDTIFANTQLVVVQPGIFFARRSPVSFSNQLLPRLRTQHLVLERPTHDCFCD